jgi:cytochrome c
VEGRKPGSHPGFSYSSAMTAFGAAHPAWDYELIYEFIKGPQADIAGTKMTYQGLKSPQDRINVIAYLHTLGSNLPIPAPNPKAPAPAAPSPGAAPAPAGAPPASGAAAPATAASTKAP